MPYKDRADGGDVVVRALHWLKLQEKMESTPCKFGERVGLPPLAAVRGQSMEVEPQVFIGVPWIDGHLVPALPLLAV